MSLREKPRYLEDDDLDEVYYMNAEEAKEKENKDYQEKLWRSIKNFEPETTARSPYKKKINSLISNDIVDTPFKLGRPEKEEKSKKTESPFLKKLYRPYPYRPPLKQIVVPKFDLNKFRQAIADSEKENEKRKLEEKRKLGVINLLKDFDSDSESEFGGGRRRRNKTTKTRRGRTKRRMRRTRRRN
jgi:hypothetical protein